MYLIRTAINDKEKAKEIAKNIVSEKAGVSVHIKKIDSIYAWEGDMCEEEEYELSILCQYPGSVFNVVDKYHTYDLPEFIAVETYGTARMEQWVDDYCEFDEGLEKYEYKKLQKELMEFNSICELCTDFGNCDMESINETCSFQLKPEYNKFKRFLR